MTGAVLLYVSTLTEGESPSVVAAIAKESRSANRLLDITGLLVFDGASFAQWVEGPSAAIADLLRRLARDRRHQDMDVLAYEQSTQPRRFPDWQLGYLITDESAIEQLRTTRDAKAFLSFVSASSHVVSM